MKLKNKGDAVEEIEYRLEYRKEGRHYWSNDFTYKTSEEALRCFQIFCDNSPLDARVIKQTLRKEVIAKEEK